MIDFENKVMRGLTKKYRSRRKGIIRHETKRGTVTISKRRKKTKRKKR